ncbi:MAG: SGNH/GDSL hydrolase family protein [Muribaculaceae bacterium]|nr:SGNH/GDSL hydrolase family protein [Muribaculaceae bacterium]
MERIKGVTNPRRGLFRRLLLMMFGLMIALSATAEAPVAKRIFIFGDSMTGWIAERLQAYGEKNGFTVDALIWDGATIRKYGMNSAALSRIINRSKPDAVFVCLGMNELGALNPEKQYSTYLTKVLGAIGDRPVIWIGPCSWPAHPQWGPKLDSWLSGKLGAAHYFNSLSLKLPRQSRTNPHPTRKGIAVWTDDLLRWIESGSAAVRLPGYATPAREYMRPKVYIYRRMRAPL